MSRSWQVPGSLSSELQTMYFCTGELRGMNDHLRPVGKPAPPRPRRPEALTDSMTCSRGGFSARIFFHASYPPIFRYVSSSHERSYLSVSKQTRFSESFQSATAAPARIAAYLWSSRI